MNRTRTSAKLAGLVGLVVLWGLAILVAIDDYDFFNSQDFGDTSRLHHEHIFIAFGLLGVVAAVLPFVLWSHPRA